MPLFRHSRSTARSRRSRNSPRVRPNSPARASARSSRYCCSARSSARPRSATASPSRTANCRSSGGCSVCSRGSNAPIDFEALDGQPVDLCFLLLAPEAAGADHLKALARVARLLRDPEIARKLRESARRRRDLRRAVDAGGVKRGVSRAPSSSAPADEPVRCRLSIEIQRT